MIMIKRMVKHDYTYILIWKSSSLSTASSSPLTSFVIQLRQPDPLQFPHTMEQQIPCFLQVHLIVLQSVWPLHQMIRKRSSGTANKSLVTGTCVSSLSFHPHSLVKDHPPFPWTAVLDSTREDYDTFLQLMQVVESGVECGIYFWQPSHKNACILQN